MKIGVYAPEETTEEMTRLHAPALFAYFEKAHIEIDYRNWSGGTSLKDIPNGLPSILIIAPPSLERFSLRDIALFAKPKRHFLILNAHGSPRQVLGNGNTRLLSIRKAFRHWLKRHHRSVN